MAGLEQIVKDSCLKACGGLEYSSQIILGEPYIEDLSESWFDTVPHPYFIANLGHGKVRKVLQEAVYVPSKREADLFNTDCFSILFFL